MAKGAEKLIQSIKEEQNKLIILENVKDKLEKERTMKLSVKEGSVSSIMSGTGTDYITPFMLTLTNNNFLIGLLSSIPGLISPLAQVLGSRMMEKYARKKIIVPFTMFQALMWIPILLISLLSWKNILPGLLPIMLIVFYTTLSVFGALAGPAWFSLMGDLIPENMRGRYFGRRNKICGTVALAATIFSSFLLDYFKTRGLVLAGFSIIFFIACISRLVSSGIFRKHYDPEFQLQPDYYFSFWQFIRKAWQTNFGRLTIFVSLMNFAVGISGPFFAVYVLNDLHFSYITYMIVLILSSSVFTLLFMPIWGRFSDKYGNRELLKIGAILVPIIPILWILSPNIYYLIFIPQLVSGVGWAAFNLAASNSIYDCVSVSKRGICVAYYNILAGFGTFLGAGLGGLLAQYITITFMNKLLFIFLVSAAARVIISSLIMSKIREVKKVHPAKNMISYFKEISPIRGIVFEIYDDLRNLTRGIVGRSKKN
jgi:MFS family permease